MVPKIKLGGESGSDNNPDPRPGAPPRGRYLSEEAQFPATQGALSPVNTAARNRKVGAQSASEPVTNATAVKPSVDRTKLWLQPRAEAWLALAWLSLALACVQRGRCCGLNPDP